MAEAVIVLRDSDGAVDIEVKLSPEKDPESPAHKLVEWILNKAQAEQVEIGNDSNSN